MTLPFVSSVTSATCDVVDGVRGMGDELHRGLGIGMRDAIQAAQLPIDLGSRIRQ